MGPQIRNGLRAGAIFGIVIIFLVLIGFEVTVAGLIGKMLPFTRTLATGPNLTPAMVNMMIFLGLLGLWAGAMGARSENPNGSWGHAIVGGLAAGAMAGLLIALFTMLFGTIHTNGVDMRKYLAAMSPEAMRLFLIGQNPPSAAVLHFGWLVLTALLGAVLARSIGRARLRGRSQELVQKLPLVDTVRRNPATRYIIYGLLLIFIMVMPLRIGQYWNYTVGTVGIYVLLGLGLNIVVGLAGLLDLGYVAFFAIGAYTVALLTAPEPHNLQWGFWVALPIAVVFSALAGVILGVPVLRLRGDYLAIVTLGFGEIIRILSKSDVLAGLTAGPRGVRAIAGPTLFGRSISNDVAFVYLIILACLLIIFVTNRLQHSRVGRAWIAMREDETVAQAMGINTLRAKLLAFGIGAAFAGLGGVLFASRNQFTGPEDHNLMVSINVLSLVIVGGMGSIPGVIAGAFALKGLPEVLRELENFRILAFGALLVAMMIIRPEGLIPSKRRQLEIHSIDEEETVPEPVHPDTAGVTGPSASTLPVSDDAGEP